MKHTPNSGEYRQVTMGGDEVMESILDLEETSHLLVQSPHFMHKELETSRSWAGVDWEDIWDEICTATKVEWKSELREGLGEQHYRRRGQQGHRAEVRVCPWRVQEPPRF